MIEPYCIVGMMTSYLYKVKEKSAQCTHMSMTRLQSPESRCSICKRDGSTVFIYECTHDDEMNLRGLVDRGELEVTHLFESLWDSFRGPFHIKPKEPWLVAKTENPLKHGPCSLPTKKASSCNNTTTATDKEYGEDRLEDIIESRELCFYSSKENQCHVKYCRNCFPCLEQRSYLELDSIVNGKIPLTSLIAYPEYERPVALAKQVRNLGLRPNTKSLVPQADTTTAKDYHITSLSGKNKDIKFNSALNKSNYLKSSRLNSFVLAKSTPRLCFGLNTRRVQRASNKFVPTIAPPSPVYAYNKTSTLNY